MWNRGNDDGPGSGGPPMGPPFGGDRCETGFLHLCEVIEQAQVVCRHVSRIDQGWEYY